VQTRPFTILSFFFLFRQCGLDALDSNNSSMKTKKVRGFLFKTKKKYDFQNNRRHYFQIKTI
jgi:hypothetical protein